MVTLRNVQYFDGEKFRTMEHIVLRDGRIDLQGEPDGEDVDCTGKFVIPGLIDTHIHFFQSAGLYTRPDGLDLRAVKSYEEEISGIRQSIPTLFKRYLACGVTGVVDCGGPFWNFDVLEESKRILAPDVAVAGPLVSTVSREKLDLGDPPIIKAENQEHARELVRRCVERDPAFVKLWYIYQEDSFEQDSLIMKAAIEETKKHGVRVAVHATELETARRAVGYGADILVHSVFDEDVDKEFVDLCVTNAVIYIPTLMVRLGYRDVYRSRIALTQFESTWGDSGSILSWRDLMTLDEELVPEPYRDLRNQYEEEPDLTTTAYRNLMKLHKAGVKIATGTDAGNVGTLHGPSLHTEMWHMCEAGMPAAEVLRSTTEVAGEVLGSGGRIEHGLPANLVVLNADPLEDIRNSTDIDSVIYEGKIYRPGQLVSPVSPSDIVQQQVEAYNARDLDRFLSYYHPRIKIYDLQSGQLRMEGLHEMRGRYGELFETSPLLNAQIRNRIALGDMVVDHEQVSGWRGQDSVEAVAYYEVKNHLITRVWFTR